MRLADDLGRRELDDRANAAGGPPRERQEAVVGPDEMAAAHGLDRDLTIAADVRVDDGENDRVLVDIRHRVGEQDRAGGDLQRPHEMRQVDDGAVRRDAAHHRVAEPDPLVAETEVAQEDDRPGGWHRRKHARASGAAQGPHDVGASYTPGPRSSAQVVSPSHRSYATGVQRRSPTRSSQTSGWLSVHRTSVARPTSSPARRAPTSSSPRTIAAWFSWKSRWMRPQSSRDVDVRRRSVPDDGEEPVDALLDLSGVPRVEEQPPTWIVLGQHLEIPRPVLDRALLAVAAQPEVPERTATPALRLEGDVDRLQRDPRFGGDRRHRRRGEALPHEEPSRRVEDLRPCRSRLGATLRRLVSMRSCANSAILLLYSRIHYS